MVCKGFQIVVMDLTSKMERYADQHNESFAEVSGMAISPQSPFNDRLMHIAEKYNTAPMKLVELVNEYHESWVGVV